MDEVSGLLSRIERLESVEQIRQLKMAYCAACDDGYNGAAIAALFHDDGVWDGGAFGRLEGPEQIDAYFQTRAGAFPFAAHLVSNEVIDVSGDEATGHWWLNMPCVLTVDGEPQAHWMLAEYTERYARRDGRWGFVEMVIDTKYLSPTSADWSSRALGPA